MTKKINYKEFGKNTLKAVSLAFWFVVFVIAIQNIIVPTGLMVSLWGQGASWIAGFVSLGFFVQGILRNHRVI